MWARAGMVLVIDCSWRATYLAVQAVRSLGSWDGLEVGSWVSHFKKLRTIKSYSVRYTCSCWLYKLFWKRSPLEAIRFGHLCTQKTFESEKGFIHWVISQLFLRVDVRSRMLRPEMVPAVTSLNVDGFDILVKILCQFFCCFLSIK